MSSKVEVESPPSHPQARALPAGAQSIKGVKIFSAESPKDTALIKELLTTTQYKFLHPAAQNKLLSIKKLSSWFTSILKMLERFENTELFLFGTIASLNFSGSDLKRRTIKLEHQGVKLEDAKHPAPEDYAALVAAEVRLFGQLQTFSQYEKFLRESSYKKEIMADADLQHLVCPALFLPSVGAKEALSKMQQFRSHEYQETVTVEDDSNLTWVSDQRTFIFPSEQRVTSAKSVTFHYVRDKKPESRIHQLLRPHFWRWFTEALTGTEFAHLLTLGWEGDHTWVIGKLIDQQAAEREESDQLFAILAVQDELRTKSPNENLMSWYVKALKTIEELNAVTRTYRSNCSLMILPVGYVESMYKVHAHREGYSEVMSRVSRENQGYMPIDKLQKAIALITVDKNRQKVYENFDAGKHNKARSNPPQVNSTAVQPSNKLDCCYKFLEGKCQVENCIHPHVKVDVPPGVCALHLADKTSCPGTCGNLHERWGSVIKKMNSGELPITTPLKKKGRRGRSEVNATAAPTAPTTSTPPDAEKGGAPSRRGRGQRGKGGRGRGDGRGGKGSKSATGDEAPEKPDVTCSRCAKKGHELAGCWASNHLDGHKLTCPKPAPIPEKFRKSVTSLNARRRLDPYSDDGDIPDDRSDGGEYFETEAFIPFAYVNMLSAVVQPKQIIHKVSTAAEYEVEDLPPLVDTSCSEKESSSEDEEPEIMELDPEGAFRWDVRNATRRFDSYYQRIYGVQPQPAENLPADHLSFNNAYLSGPLTPESPMTREPGSLVTPIEESKERASLVVPALEAHTRQ